ncbi:MAG: isochorismatase family protein [Thermodesulfobacteriota bacterium]|nr:isochorismatase family protein [Thermodesulfobacteriota bacterium]
MRLALEIILKELKPYRARKAVVHPEHAAFLAIDLQNYFKRIAQPVLGNILKVIQSCRKMSIPIIFTQHGHTHPDSDGGTLGQWWGELIIAGTEDWKFLPEIVTEGKDVILPKKRYSAFFETDLDEMLRSKGIQDLIVSGVMTNLCCETTARDAFMRNYRVFFLVDGTATRRGDLHLATLKNMGFGFAYLLTCEELIQML